MKMKSETETPEQKLARRHNGGYQLMDKDALDRVWRAVQDANRAAGPWGVQPKCFEKPEEVWKGLQQR